MTLKDRINALSRKNTVNVDTAPVLQMQMSQRQRERREDSSSSSSSKSYEQNKVGDKSLFENKKWFLPEAKDLDAVEELAWKPKEKYLIKDILNKVDSIGDMYSQCEKRYKDRYQRWIKWQQIVGFSATVFAFFSASALPATIAESSDISAQTMNTIFALIIGFLSIILTAINEFIKKGDFQVKIQNFSQIYNDYMGVRYFIESEIRFHKTEAMKLEAKVSRILQELQVTHQNVQVPTDIERTLEKIFDYTKNDADKKSMTGMSRDELIENYAIISAAQRRIRLRKIGHASGLSEHEMNEIQIDVKDQMRADKSKAKKKRRKKKESGFKGMTLKKLQAFIEFHCPELEWDAATMRSKSKEELISMLAAKNVVAPTGRPTNSITMSVTKGASLDTERTEQDEDGNEEEKGDDNEPNFRTTTKKKKNKT